MSDINFSVLFVPSRMKIPPGFDNEVVIINDSINFLLSGLLHGRDEFCPFPAQKVREVLTDANRSIPEVGNGLGEDEFVLIVSFL